MTTIVPDNEINFLIHEASLLGTSRFLFKYQKQYGQKASFAATQAELRTYAQLKLPTFHENDCLYTKRSLEQCTSETVARYKASLFKGGQLLVLAAGLGVDDWAFSRSFDKIVSVEPDEELNAISRHNFARLQCSNIERIALTAEAFLECNTTSFDMVYSDPDRRNDEQRQILLSQHQPNIIALLPELGKMAGRLLIKCSPLYDHEMASREIPGISDIYIISLKGEVKEMLLSVDLHVHAKNDIKMHCVELGRQEELSVSFMDSGNNIPRLASEISGYFYEASAGIAKARKHHHYASLKGLSLIDKSIPFYCSEKMIDPFIGRRFQITHVMPFQARACVKFLAENKITKANIKVRGLKFNTAEAYKKLGIKEGGDSYLFIFPSGEGSMIAFCRYQAFTPLI